MMFPTLNIFSAKAATATGTAHLVEGYDKATFELKTASNANFTIKFQGSWAETKPDFSSNASATNSWVYLNTKDSSTGNAKDGATGIASAGTDVIQTYEINGAVPRWICATITGYTAGAITLNVIPQHLVTAQA